MFEKNLELAELLDHYGSVLGERHRAVLDYYYCQDLSLGEIAAELGISRQGVRDSIKRAEEELLFFERSLGLSARARAVAAAGERALRLTGENKELREAVEQLMAAAGQS